MKITPINLAKRVQFWQKKLAPLGIAHWRIDAVHITDEMPVDGAQASVRPSGRYASFEIWFEHEAVENLRDMRELDELIVHELYHVAMRDLDWAIGSAAEDLSPSQSAEWGARVHHEREGLVDGTARLIVELHYAPQA